MASSWSLKEGLILKKDSALENIEEIVEEHGEQAKSTTSFNLNEYEEYDNDTPMPIPMPIQSDTLTPQNQIQLVAEEIKNTEETNPEQLSHQTTAELLNEKARRQRVARAATSRINNVFLLFLLPFFMVLCMNLI